MIDQSDVNSVTNDIVSLRELVSAFLLTNFSILPRRTTRVDACFTLLRIVGSLFATFKADVPAFKGCWGALKNEAFNQQEEIRRVRFRLAIVSSVLTSPRVRP